MTRRTALVFAAVVVSLFTLASTSLALTSPAGAASPCTGKAQEHCEAMAAADEAVLFHAAVAPAPLHLLAGNGIGQEHFEAMATEQFTALGVSAPVPPMHLPGKAIEHYEAMTAQTADR